jgi:hypothetical protein
MKKKKKKKLRDSEPASGNMYYLIADSQWKSSLKFGHFLKKWQGGTSETKFCNFKIFFWKRTTRFRDIVYN